MKKIMVVALCGIACATQQVFAADDFGIESASPVSIADPVNPQPGMILKAYNLQYSYSSQQAVSRLKEGAVKLPSLPAAKTVVDKNEDFSMRQFGKSGLNAGLWSGFLKCKRAGVYTLNLMQNCDIPFGGYSLRINGKPVLPVGEKLTSVDVELKVGWNKFDLVGMFFRQAPLTITYKPKESLSEPRALTPGMLFFDKKIEEEW